ncbi:GatB/YqeY domain-containing protein [Effusibacillus pohliae]|uniref:GatB/YqeY domain-containing protein n=1 Tax=Effusibacillus pohliae TaxID=232270 RepID=UPI00035E6F30|nr:GatB/YqeY domain-containing protein [Effusibacillus pohliae]
MGLAERLDADMKQAMKDKDKIRLSTIRLIRTAIKNAEIDQQKTLTDEDILAVLNRELKQRRDSLQAFQDAGRADLVDQVQREIAVLQEYLPAQLNEDEIRELVQATIAEVGALSKKDMGKVMGALMPKVQGRADGKLVNQIVQSYLS